jgi:hypothetical protein
VADLLNVSEGLINQLVTPPWLIPRPTTSAYGWKKNSCLKVSAANATRPRRNVMDKAVLAFVDLDLYAVGAEV